MPRLAPERKERLSRLGLRFEQAFCVGLFIAASMPALIVMLLISFPLLPLFGGILLSVIAIASGPKEALEIEHRADDGGRERHPPEHGAPTPHYA